MEWFFIVLRYVLACWAIGKGVIGLVRHWRAWRVSNPPKGWPDERWRVVAISNLFIGLEIVALGPVLIFNSVFGWCLWVLVFGLTVITYVIIMTVWEFRARKRGPVIWPGISDPDTREDGLGGEADP